MGYETEFYGRLDFMRRLGREDLDILQTILDAGKGRMTDEELDQRIYTEAKNERDERGGGPIVISGWGSAEFRAEHRGFAVGEGLDPFNAGHLRISDDGEGLVYRSEKSYSMVEGVNFIIANGRVRIPDFGLKGSLYAVTEFEPYAWLLKIGPDGLAHQEPCDRNALWRHSKSTYLRRIKLRVEWLIRRPVCEAASRHKLKKHGGFFRKSADALCSRLMDREAAYLRWRWKHRYGKDWPDIR